MANQIFGRMKHPDPARVGRSATSQSSGSLLVVGLLKGTMYLVLTAGAATMVLPFLWMLSTSVMTLGEANTGRLLPRSARLSCPHVNLTKTVEGGVSEFAVSPTVRQGAQELHTDSYYVEVQQVPGAQSWQFRLVDNAAKPVSIAIVGQPGSAFSGEWQPIPEGGGSGRYRARDVLYLCLSTGSRGSRATFGRCPHRLCQLLRVPRLDARKATS